MSTMRSMSPTGYQFPGDCEYDGTRMDVTERGIRCSHCGHEIYNEQYTNEPALSRTPLPSEPCHCFNCFKKREQERQ